MKQKQSRTEQQRGFSLVELFFAIFIVALGIAGVMLTMSRLIQFQSESRGDQRAATALSELTQRIRMIQMINVLASAAIAGSDFTTTAEATSTSTCLDSPCNLSQLTRQSMADWRNNRVTDILGDGSAGVIEDLNTTPRAFRVTLRWLSTADAKEDAAAYRSCDNVPGAATSIHRCAQVVIIP